MPYTILNYEQKERAPGRDSLFRRSRSSHTRSTLHGEPSRDNEYRYIMEIGPSTSLTSTRPLRTEERLSDRIWDQRALVECRYAPTDDEMLRLANMQVGKIHNSHKKKGESGFHGLGRTRVVNAMSSGTLVAMSSNSQYRGEKNWEDAEKLRPYATELMRRSRFDDQTHFNLSGCAEYGSMDTLIEHSFRDRGRLRRSSDATADDLSFRKPLNGYNPRSLTFRADPDPERRKMLPACSQRRYPSPPIRQPGCIDYLPATGVADIIPGIRYMDETRPRARRELERVRGKLVDVQMISPRGRSR